MPQTPERDHRPAVLQPDALCPLANESKVGTIKAEVVGQRRAGAEHVRILLATDAASEGIDLHWHCHRLVNYDIPFNPNKLEQRIGRIDRYGQKHNPEVRHFVGSGWEGAAEAFGYQLPELRGGDERTAWPRPAPYPAACHPRAWSAVASVALLQAVLGVYPDVPSGIVHIRPLAGAPVGVVAVRGLRVAGAEIGAAVTRDGDVTPTGVPALLRVVRRDRAAMPAIPTQPTGPEDPGWASAPSSPYAVTMIRVGVLGTGFGETHVELYKRIDGFEVVSVFGRDEGKLARFGEKHGVPTTADVNGIIRNPEIDLIDVCLPTELHAQWAIEGLKNGKHVFLETPVASGVDEAVAIREAAAKYGKDVFVDLFIKFSAPHQYAMDLVKTSECGRLLSIRSYNRTSPRWGDLGLQKNVANFHNHMVDFALGIGGMPESVAASGIDYGDRSIVTSALKYEGMYAVLESNSGLPKCCPFEIGFELFCTDGVIRFDAAFGDHTKEEFSITRNGRAREGVCFDEQDDYEEVVKHIRHCLTNGVRSESIDIEAAISALRVKDLILASLYP